MTIQEAPADAKTEQPYAPPASAVHPASKGARSPLLWVPTLYAAESLPFNAVILVSVMMYKSFGLSDSTIAFWTSWLLLPWALKPFFGPLLETRKSKKGIVVVTETFAGACFGVMAFCLPLPFWFQASLSVFAIMAFNSATHDMAADGLYIDALDTVGQAKYVGWQSGFWNIGQALAQGGLTFLAGKLEQRYDIVPAWAIVWGAFGVLMLGFAAYHAVMAPRGRAPAVLTTGVADIINSFREVSTDFFLKKNIWWLIAFALLFRTAEGQIEKIAQLFLRGKVADGGLGLSTADVGLAYGATGTLAMVAGSVVGGWFASKVGLKKAAVPLAIILNVPNVLFTYLAASQNSKLWVVITCAGLEKFSLGMGFVAMTLVLMQQMAPGKYSTAHYGFATALMNVGMMVPSMTSGFVSDLLGYKRFFVYILVMGLPSIIITMLVPIRDDPGSIEVPDDERGNVIKTGAWATALTAGSLYLFITFNGVVTGPLYFGQPISWAYVVILGVLAVFGFLLLGFGVKTALKARAIARKLAAPVKNQSTLAIVLAVIATIAWTGSARLVWAKQQSILALREQCASTHELSACEPVCKNDATYDVCLGVMHARIAEFDAKPDDAAVAKSALEVTRQTLESGCFVVHRADDCIALGDMSATPGKWLKADLEEDVCDAKRYYAKACSLKDSRGCTLAEDAKAKIAAEKKDCASSTAPAGE
jgi:MFS transporter, PAT family, beta-lactamase induction signal transducer AmpG